MNPRTRVIPIQMPTPPLNPTSVSKTVSASANNFFNLLSTRKYIEIWKNIQFIKKKRYNNFLPILEDNAGETLNQEGMDMEDPVVQAIMNSRELYRDHPPAIKLEDYVVDVCFHPAQDLIALASITGDVLM